MTVTDTFRRSPAARLRDVARGNVLWLGIVSLLNDAASEMIFPLLPLFIVGTLGAGPAFLGVIEGVAETTASLGKFAGGWLSDRLRRRKALIVWGYGLAAAARPLVALAAAPWHVLAVRFADRSGKGVRTAPRDALLAASADPARRGAAFGIHRAADHVGAVLGPLIATAVLLAAPGNLRLVFALAAVPGALSLVVLAARVREAAPPATVPVPQPGAADRTRAPTAGVLSSVVAVGAPPDHATQAAGLGRPFRRLLLVLIVFTLGNASDAFLLLRARELGVSVALIPIIWGALHVSKALWSVPGGALADRAGPRRAIFAGWLLYAAVYAGFAMATNAWHAWALFLVYGLVFGLTEAPERALVAELAPADRAATAFGAFHFAVGLAALPASVIFGVVWQAFGADAAFGLGAALALLAAAMLPLTDPQPARTFPPG